MGGARQALLRGKRARKSWEEISSGIAAMNKVLNTLTSHEPKPYIVLCSAASGVGCKANTAWAPDNPCRNAPGLPRRPRAHQGAADEGDPGGRGRTDGRGREKREVLAAERPSRHRLPRNRGAAPARPTPRRVKTELQLRGVTRSQVDEVAKIKEGKSALVSADDGFEELKLLAMKATELLQVTYDASFTIGFIRVM